MSRRSTKVTELPLLNALTGDELFYCAKNNLDHSVLAGTLKVTYFTDLSDVPHSYSGQAFKSIRVNAGESGLEFFTAGGTGTITGPASSTDNAIVRWDGTSGLITQNSTITVSDIGEFKWTNPFAIPAANYALLYDRGGFGYLRINGEGLIAQYINLATSSLVNTQIATFGGSLGGDGSASGGGDGSANQFSLYVPTVIPFTGSAGAYEKAAIYANIQSDDPSNSVTYRDFVAIEAIATYTGTAAGTGRVFGIHTAGQIATGSDASIAGLEVAVVNNGSDQPLNDTITTKQGIHVVADGTAPTTSGIRFNATAPGMYHNMIFAYPDRIVTGGYLINSPDCFVVAKTGDVAATSTSSGNTGPVIEFNHFSASPAINDYPAQIHYRGKDSAGNTTIYGEVDCKIRNPVDGAEDSVLELYVQNAGSEFLHSEFAGTYTQFNRQTFVQSAITPTLWLFGSSGPSIKFNPSSGATQNAWLYQTADTIRFSTDSVDLWKLSLATGAVQFMVGYGVGTIRSDASGNLASSKISSAVVSALVDGATPALDASQGTIFTLLAGGDRIIAVPTNPTDGQKIVIRHKASGAPRTLSLNTGVGGFRFGTDISTLTQTESGKTDYIGAIYHQTDNKWDVVAYAKGYV